MQTRILLIVGVFVLVGCTETRPVAEISVGDKPIEAAAEIEFQPTDWPWWRGPARNNTSAADSIVTEWGESKNVLWKTKVPGRGHGSPTILGNQIFLATADEQQQVQSVICFDRETGQQTWETEIHRGKFAGRSEMHPTSTHANGTVATDGKSLFIGFLNDQKITATSLDLEGKINWQTELGFFGSKFGYAPSPCLHKSLAIFAGDNQGGGFIAAVHRETGDIVWRIARDNTNTYSSAVVTNVGGKDQLIISGINRVTSYDPDTGDEFWRCDGTAEATCGTAVWHNNLVFASGGYPDKNTVCIDATTGDKKWEDRNKSYEQSMLVANGLLFALTDNAILLCRDPETGKELWKERLSGKVSASPLLVGDNIYASNERGTTWVFKASGEGYEQIAKNELGNEGFASPVPSGSQLFIRTATGNGPQRQEFLYCLQQD